MGIATGRLALAFSLCAGSPALADDVADFYRGKTITLVISVGEGDGMDQAARLIARHWSNHLPGKPSFIAKNMPGAGSLLATNFIYNQAPRDGTVIGAIIPAFVMQQMLGGTGVNYDAAKLRWIGSSNKSNPTVYVWHETGVTSLQQAKDRQILLGGTGVGSNSVHYPMILNHIAGTKFKVVMGYRSAPEVNLAVQRGEVHGRAGETFNTLMLNSAALVRDRKLNILVQIGDEKERGFDTIPLLTDFAPDDASRQVLQLFSDEISLGRPYIAPPDIPADRLEALRSSFDDAMKDPTLLADAKTIRLDIVPATGARLEQTVTRMLAIKGDVLARAKTAMESDEETKKPN